MRVKKRFSIRYKFLAVITLLLILCVGAYLLIAVDALKLDKEELVFDYKRSLVTTVASEAESLLKKSLDNIKLVAHFFKNRDGTNLKIVEGILEADSDVIFVSGSKNFKDFDTVFYQNSSYFDTYAVSEKYFNEELIRSRPIPVDKIQKNGEAIWNATIVDGPPLIGFGKSIVEENAQGQPIGQFAIVTYIRADKILKTLQQVRLNEVFVLNQDGSVLVHSNPFVMQNRNFYSDDPIFLRAKSDSMKTSAFKYDNDKMLGAYSKSYKDQIFVISKVSVEKAFASVRRLIYRSLLFALIVFSLAFIAAILFSRSLTRPIESLTLGMRKVSDGDLTTQIHVNTRDEIQLLAKNFNTMIRDLKTSREELEEINRDLENKVKERTKELQERNEAVKKAQEALLRTTRLAAVGEIAGNTAHEVLNPLTVMMTKIQKLKSRLENHIISEARFLKDLTSSWEKDYGEGGFNQLVEAWEEPSKVKPQQTLWEEDIENLKKIGTDLHAEYETLMSETDFLIREGMRINKIVQKMRSLSAIKADPKPHSVSKLLSDSAKIMADLASQIDAKILVVGDGDCIVMVDEDEFIQVMVNLIRNSLHSIRSRKQADSTLEGQVTLRMGKSGKNAILDIEDNGVGILKENHGKLFESQFSTKPNHEGTGLGLGISRRLIRAFGGDLYLKSSSFEGTAFVIQLPLTEIIQMKEPA